MKEDEEKFKFVDEDGDGKLDLEEYMVFYYLGVWGKIILLKFIIFFMKKK